MRSRVIAVVVAVLVLGACSAVKVATPERLPEDEPGPPVTYVAVGASESVGYGTGDPLREAWPQVLYKTSLPRRTVFVNLGIPGATVEDAMDREVPDAVGLAPTLVTVWLNVNDIIDLVSPDKYEDRLGDLVHALRRDGKTKVLVANTPPVDHLPAYLACRPDPPKDGPKCMIDGIARLLVPGPSTVNKVVDGYNAATERVVKKEGAVLVDLHGRGLAARAAGEEDKLVSGDGFHPSTLGHRAVAEAFAAALKASGGP